MRLGFAAPYNLLAFYRHFSSKEELAEAVFLYSISRAASLQPGNPKALRPSTTWGRLSRSFVLVPFVPACCVSFVTS